MSESIDLGATIAAHPWRSIAIALAAGAWLALEPPRPRGRLGRSLVATVGGVTVGVARDFAMRRALGLARTWLDERLHAAS
jgi:hypothetical protein